MKKTLGGWLIAVAMAAGCGNGSSGGHLGTGESVTKMVGAAGGSVTIDGLQIMIPPGSVSGDVPITVTSTTDAPPAGFQALSPIYRLSPAGLTFAQPVEVRLTLTGNTSNVTVFWSKLSGSGFDNVGGTVTGNQIVASNTHFSSVFAADKPAILSVSPATHDFGSVVMGAASTTATVTVSNTGGSTSDVLVAALAGADASQFQIAGGTCGAPLDPAATCEVSVRYAPSRAGAATASLTVVGALGGDATVILSGTGLPPASLTIGPLAQDFGTVSAGASSAAVTFTVTNGGGNASGPLTVSFGGSFPGAFTLGSDACSSVVLAPAATCAVAVRFAPSAAGAVTATLTVSGAPGGTTSAALAGNALSVANLTVSPAAQDFGSVTLGNHSTPATFTVSNSGGVASGAVTNALGGADAAQFHLDSSSCAAVVLAPGASCTIQVSFVPTSAGARSATLTIGATPGGTTTVVLSALAQATASLTISPTLHDFGAQPTGTTSAATTFTIINEGGTTTTALSAALTGAGASSLAIISNSCSVLPTGSSCAIQVRFAPTTTGAKTASLSVTGSAGESVAAALSGSGLTPASLTISPQMQDYGVHQTGTTSPAASFSITNNGGLAASALTVSLAGTNPAAFQLGASTCTTTLAAGASCTVEVSFAPTSAGPASAQLVVSGSPGTALASLSGSGQTPASLAISPPSRSFADQLTGTAGAPLAFTVSNPGGGPTGILTVVLAGADPGDFMVSADSCGGATLSATATCTLSVSFAPTAAGARAASVTVSDGAGHSASAPLSGTATAPASISVSPPTASFGSLQIGSTSAAVTFTISNGGGLATGMLSVSLTGGDNSQFLLGSSTCNTLAPGATCSVAVSFAPTTIGAKTASLSISGAGTVSAALSGTGLGASNLTLSPPTAAYGSAMISSTGPAVTFTVSNSGGVSSGVVSVSLTGADPGQFQVVSNSCGVLAPAATCTVGVSFAPTSRGAKSASLTVAANPGGSLSATLSGTGLAAASLAIGPPFADFGTVLSGGSSGSINFTVTNTGDQTSSAVNAALGGSSPGDFQIFGSSCGVALAPAASCVVQARFAPSTSGSKSATLTATAAATSATAFLSGTGAAPASFQITPSLRDYGSVGVGSSSFMLNFTVTNTGGSTSGLITAIVGGGNPGDFSVQSDGCSGLTLSPGLNCTLGVVFSPSATGSRSASLTAAAGVATATAFMSGNGL